LAGLSTYQVGVLALPLMVSQTRTVPTISRSQPVGVGLQSLAGVFGLPLKSS